MTEQPTPTVSPEDIDRVVRRDYPADDVETVTALLAEYGDESWHREPVRVRLAVLKLAAGSVDRLRRHLDTANVDYRDALAAAEYPGYMRRVSAVNRMDPAEVQRVTDQDWQQYREWLYADSAP